jgi:ribosome-associated protein
MIATRCSLLAARCSLLARVTAHGVSRERVRVVPWPNLEGVEDPIVIEAGAAVPLSEIELRASRSSGPGGQHANVTASRVEAVFEIAASASLSEEHKRRLADRYGPRVAAVAQDARGQARNRELALERLREKLAAGLAAPRKRRPTKPTQAARERRLESKRRVAERKRARRPPPVGD